MKTRNEKLHGPNNTPKADLDSVQALLNEKKTTEAEAKLKALAKQYKWFVFELHHHAQVMGKRAGIIPDQPRVKRGKDKFQTA